MIGERRGSGGVSVVKGMGVGDEMEGTRGEGGLAVTKDDGRCRPVKGKGKGEVGR